MQSRRNPPRNDEHVKRASSVKSHQSAARDGVATATKREQIIQRG
jgi:hypothetical protein